VAREEVWTIPNLFTLARLVLGFVVFALIDAGQFRWALLVFVVAAATDAVDGYLARAFGQTSAIGRQLDPLVDKLIVLGAMVFLVAVPGSGFAPWMVVVILVRELGVQTIRSLVEGRGVAFGARSAGKLKMVLQCLAVTASLATQGLDGQQLPLLARDLLIWAALATTVYSGVSYAIAAWPHLRESAQT
jgi:CDP-diacylglycerol--glycerol-3-phosphate 3-phosphatidyltransferase